MFLAVFLCLAAIMEDQIKVEGWELEALEESLVCYKPTREICGVCGYVWGFVPNVWGVDSKYRNTAVVFTPFGRCLRVNWESFNTARKEKRKKPKEKRSTRKKISYDHAVPQVWKKH